MSRSKLNSLYMLFFAKRNFSINTYRFQWTKDKIYDVSKTSNNLQVLENEALPQFRFYTLSIHSTEWYKCIQRYLIAFPENIQNIDIVWEFCSYHIILDKLDACVLKRSSTYDQNFRVVFPLKISYNITPMASCLRLIPLKIRDTKNPPLARGKRWLDWRGLSDETWETEALCHSRCGTIKILPVSRLLVSNIGLDFASFPQYWDVSIQANQIWPRRQTTDKQKTSSKSYHIAKLIQL